MFIFWVISFWNILRYRIIVSKIMDIFKTSDIEVPDIFSYFILFFLKYFIYLFLEREEGREKERERNINVWLPLTWPPLGTWPATQACALTGNWTGDPLVHSPYSVHWTTPARFFPILKINVEGWFKKKKGI